MRQNKFCYLNKFILTIIILFFAYDSNSQIEIGDHIKADAIVIDSLSLLMTNSGTIEKSYTIIYLGITYNICLNPKREIKFISTSDKKFITSEGLKIKMKYNKIKNCEEAECVHIQPGWAKYVNLKNGWKAAFDFNALITKKSKILFFLKYKINLNNS